MQDSTSYQHAVATIPTRGLVDAILETSHDAFVGMDANGRVVLWNRQAEFMFGWTDQEVIGKLLGDLIVPPELRAAHAKGMARYQATGEGQVVNRRVRMQALRRHGELFLVDMTIKAYQGGESRSEWMFFAFLHDASERNKTESALAELARTDLLTTLPNRRHLYERLQETMARVSRTKRLMAVMFMDIDHFKKINDGLGHDIGDQLLQQFATHLRTSVRQVDFVGRLGGDEFLVIVEELNHEDNVIIIARKIVEGMVLGFQVGEQSLHITTSIGIALYDGGTLIQDELIRRADQAMYQAKRSGRNTFRIAREDTEPSRQDKVLPAPLIKFMSRPTSPVPDIDSFMQEALRAIRTHMDMDVAFIAHFTNGNRVFRYVDSKDANPPIAVGGSDPLEDSYCQRVVDGRLPEIIPDAFLNSHAMTMPVTQVLPVRAHISLPIIMKNGVIYGTFCCFSYSPDQSLNERDLSMMKVFAELVARQLERELS